MSGSKLRNLLFSAVLFLGFSLATPMLTDQSVEALSGSDFQAGRIMDDGVFYNANSMSEGQIQEFLNAKLSVCDTNGDKLIYDSAYGDTVTRRVYSERRGISTPFTCLKDYRQDTGNKSPEDMLCNGHVGGNKSAARIIKDVADSCGVSPKVLIILLQKEQSLVTDDWPWPRQYRSATGYGCPDTAPCDAQYYGFFNQVYMAARIYKYYAKYPNSFNHVAGRNNNILYHPNSACGRASVYIHNQATAGLYNYTPYQPNAAALNNLYGTGDGCSSYGNRNFWRLFNDWFGSTQTNIAYGLTFVSQQTYSDESRTMNLSSIPTTIPGGKIYVTLKVRNNGYETWDKSIVRLGTSRPIDRASIFKDSGWLRDARPTSLKETSVLPGQIGTFEFTLQAPEAPGSYKEYFNVVAEGITWLNDIGMHTQTNVVPLATTHGTTKHGLSSGQSLLPGEYLLSPDRQAVLTLQKDGNLVLYENFKAVWDSKTPGKKPQKLILQSDGNLVLYDVNNSAYWSSGTDGNTNNLLALQIDGNLVIYSQESLPLWDIGNVHNPNHLYYVNNKLPRSKIFPGQQLETPDRKYRLALQTDGNLVLYSPTRAIWNTGTVGKPTSFAAMQSDGNLVIYDNSGRPLWSSGTAGQGLSVLAIQQDGNTVIYNNAGGATWSSGTAGVE